ncbi:MAG: SGNH/GDSL hydrolase family protein [Bdellovibrionota bacterium]
MQKLCSDYPLISAFRFYGRFGLRIVQALVVVEVGLFLISRFVSLPISTPSYSLSRWRGGTVYVETDPAFGVWHLPNLNTRAEVSCTNVSFRTNTYGARDSERSLFGPKRTVVLGDSFVEGMGVEESDRFTNVLERETGGEFLNFGTAGYFGPTQYLMLYRALASKFEHDTVLVGLLPANDFLEDDISYGREILPDRYRPYFVGAYPEYRLEYYQPERPKAGIDRFWLRHLLREFTWVANAWDSFKFRRFRRSGYSGYFDYSSEQFERLRYVLQLLRKDSAGKRLVVVTLPQTNDFLRARTELPPLPERMTNLAAEIGFEYLDLLEPLPESEVDIRGMSLCDGHWNATGHGRAARLLRPVLLSPHSSDLENGFRGEPKP